MLSEINGHSDIVDFKGFLPFPELTKIISSADVGIVPLLPTPFGELCQPNKLFDYISLKIPVIAPQLPAIVETFDESCVMFYEAGSSKDMAQGILKLYLNPGKRLNLAQNAYRRYDSIKWEKTKKIYLKIIEGLVRENI